MATRTKKRQKDLSFCRFFVLVCFMLPSGYRLEDIIRIDLVLIVGLFVISAEQFIQRSRVFQQAQRAVGVGSVRPLQIAAEEEIDVAQAVLVLDRKKDGSKWRIELRETSQLPHLRNLLLFFLIMIIQTLFGELRLPPDRVDGPDPFRFADQLREFGSSFEGMPLIQVTQGLGEELMISDGVTRSVRLHMMEPDAIIFVEVIETANWDFRHLPKVREL